MELLKHLEDAKKAFEDEKRKERERKKRQEEAEERERKKRKYQERERKKRQEEAEERERKKRQDQERKEKDEINLQKLVNEKKYAESIGNADNLTEINRIIKLTKQYLTGNPYFIIEDA